MNFFVVNKDIYIYSEEDYFETILIIKEKENDFYEFTLIETITKKQSSNCNKDTFNEKYVNDKFLRSKGKKNISVKNATLEELGYRKEWLTMFYT